MEHELILLLLGLALLLTTSSFLLDTSGSGREGNGGNPESNSYNSTEPGEISGSVSITSSGELWLTIFVDQLSILAKISVVKNIEGTPMYSFAIIAIAEIASELENKPKQLFSHSDINKNKVVTFTCPDEASKRIVEMLKNLKIELSQDALRSLPYAVSCGWKPPQECEILIQSLLKEHSGE